MADDFDARSQFGSYDPSVPRSQGSGGKSRAEVTRNRGDVARRMSALSGRPQHECRPWIEVVLRAVTELLEEADPEVRVELRGFGTFHVRVAPARIAKGKQPKPLLVQSRRRVKFRPARSLRESMAVPLVELGHEPPEGALDA